MEFPPDTNEPLAIDPDDLRRWLSEQGERSYPRFRPTESALATYLIESRGIQDAFIAFPFDIHPWVQANGKVWSLPTWARLFEIECDCRPSGNDDWMTDTKAPITNAQALAALERAIRGAAT